jgi:hypothetical protein
VPLYACWEEAFCEMRAKAFFEVYLTKNKLSVKQGAARERMETARGNKNLPILFYTQQAAKVEEAKILPSGKPWTGWIFVNV